MERFPALIVSMSYGTIIALQSVLTVDYNNNLSITIVVIIAFQVLFINLLNSEQLMFASEVFIINVLNIYF